MALLKIKVGGGARGLLNYISRDHASGYSEPIHTNMAGRNPREMTKEFGVFRELRPNLKKAVGHLILAISSEDESSMTPHRWQRAIDIALETHGITDAPFAAWLHHDTDHLHCHIFFSRIRADGSVISDSHSYRKNEAAARQMERELGLKPPAPLPPEKQPGDRRALENASRRAERKGEKLDYLKIKSTVEAAIDQGAASPEALAAALQAAGYRAEFTRRGHGPDGEIAGWRIADLAAGDDATAIKASAIHRDLAWARVAERLAANRPTQATPERVQDLAGATDMDRLTARLEAADVTIHRRRDEDGEVSGWSWEVAGERAAASSLDPRLGWGGVQMALRDAQQRAGLAPPPLGGRPQRGHGLAPAARQAGEASLSRRLRVFGFRAVEAEGAALWSNKRGDQLRALPDRVELHPAPARAGAARWDDRAVSAWVLAAKLTQGDRLSLVNAGELAPELRRALVEACAAEGVTITELADDIQRERERLVALGATLPASGQQAEPLGLRAAPETPAEGTGGGRAAPATAASQPSHPPATDAAQPSPSRQPAGQALLSRLHALRFTALEKGTPAEFRQRAAQARERRHEIKLDRWHKGDAIEEAIERARRDALAEAKARMRREHDEAAGAGQVRFTHLSKAWQEAERALKSARDVPEPPRLKDPLGRAAARRQAVIDQAERARDAALARLKDLEAKVIESPQRREDRDRLFWLAYAAAAPDLLEFEHMRDLERDLEKAAQDAEQREREAAAKARIAAAAEAARQRLQEAQAWRDEEEDDDEEDGRRYERQRGG